MLTTKQIERIVAKVQYKDWRFVVLRGEIRALFDAFDPELKTEVHYSFPMGMTLYESVDELVGKLAELIVWAESPQARDGYDVPGRPVDPAALKAALLESV